MRVMSRTKPTETTTDSGTGERIDWGVHIGKQKGSFPFIQRFDLVEAE